mmetsp:Transcript_36502/g.88464  ORF Transcript_36502/g.88464 Transcript_36502/m.88464 type:complete len:249 (-) Transcript_36502:932-1678(-)|eukprot:CAMPEP_0113617258 /NCGR_PEP_ID=MMETSP0017_2-20120614/8682_1 /TAXON_ID=2856 /ORGANISM="Cylindrotheca closterium" /LENGTH=248 /DNA_ID=CAMNT_0000526637 /DNA_START=201 /DNA_END=947 /DNA_ORIENTATION=- /assembly_acc=CAM_ASM_000147
MTKIVNKFLSKSFHMVSDSDPDIVSWNGVGDSFTIKDIDAFQKHVLPKYFNHSKFTSYVRQLNFYGFQKMSQDTDIRIIPKEITSKTNGNASDDESSHAESVSSTSNQQNPSSSSSISSVRNPANNSARFMHQYFRRGMPELLSKIQRSTAKPKVPAMELEDYEALHKQIAELKGQISQMESQVDQKVEQAVQLVRNDYMTKVTQLEASYQSLVSVVSLLLNGKPAMGLAAAAPTTAFPSLQQLFKQV